MDDLIKNRWEATDRFRIRPPFYFVTVNENEVILKGGTWGGSTFVINDAKKLNLVGPIMKMVDSQCTLEEITQRFGIDLEEEVLQFLYSMHNKQLIDRVPEAFGDVKLKAEEKERFEPLFSFLSAISHQPLPTTTSRLRNSEVLVVGVSSIGSRVAMQLAQAGVGKLRLLDDSLITKDEVFFTPVYGLKDVGLRRSEVLANHITGFIPTAAVHDVNGNNKLLENTLAEAMEGCQWVIVASEEPNLSLYNKINALALKKKIKWSIATLDGVDGLIGPTFIPYETCCYVCYEMRLESNMVNYHTYKDYKETMEKDYNAVSRRSIPGLMSLTDIIAGFISYDCIRGIATEYSFTYGKALRINFQSGMVETNDVLKLPRCPVCGVATRGRPNEQLFFTFDKIVKELEI